MPTPLHTAAYPLVMLDAITRVISTGEPLEIPTSNPIRTRLQFHGLKAALRRENRAELADPWAVSIPKDHGEPRIVIYLREHSLLASEISAALGSALADKPPSQVLDAMKSRAAESAEEAFNRIMGITK